MHRTRIHCCSVFEVWFSTRLCAKVPHLLWVTQSRSAWTFFDNCRVHTTATAGETSLAAHSIYISCSTSIQRADAAPGPLNHLSALTIWSVLCTETAQKK